ncbi:MAG: lipid-A-disaccharide synthase [Kiritimatiellae bacterium]|nr:lipid-A-disaccharide synthase [Kiritimatiellia bacterium]MDD5521441.1 lipid-A-disaccharide synthase [Kiritimatiellia bacterium]
MNEQNTNDLKSPSIMIIAGEISGDMHASMLVRAIKERKPETVIYGIGGERMRTEGVETFYDIEDMAVMGFWEVFKRFFFFSRVFNQMLKVACERKPDAVILVDYPGFNLRFAEKVHAMGIKTIYYICPQVWAWNQSRIPKMVQFVDRLISIFPFEAEYFDGTKLKVDYVGHPLVDEVIPYLTGDTLKLPWQDGKPRVAILPGSRKNEIERILPVMWKTMVEVEKQHPNASFIIATPSEEIAEFIRNKLATLSRGPDRCEIVVDQTRHVLRQATAAMVASGTATIETALMQCPMVIIYVVSRLTYFFAKRLIKVKNIGMVNIVAGTRLCPEFIQNKAKPVDIAKAMNSLLVDTPDRGFMVIKLKEVSDALGEGGAAERAADIIVDEIS